MPDVLQLALQASLTLLVDSLAQPGSLLLQALLQLHANTGKPSAILCTSFEPAAFLQDLQLPQTTCLDAFHASPRLQIAQRYRHVEDPLKLDDALPADVDTLFIDSLSMISALSSVRQTLLLLRSLQAARPHLKIIALVSTDLEDQPSLLDALYSLPQTRSCCRLSIHPVALLHALKAVYNLSSQAPATHSFLQRFQARGWAGHGYRSQDADDIERQTACDELGQNGKAVLQWEVRGQDLLRFFQSSTPVGVAQKSGEAPTKAESIKRGLLALQRDAQTVLKVLPVEELTSKFTTDHSISQQDTTMDDISATLPFNLSLTAQQRAEKESTILPFHREAGDRDADAIIHYDADSADDIDEEEGDED